MATEWTGRVPWLDEVVTLGGNPGIEYAFISPDNEYHFSQDGWARTMTVTDDGARVTAPPMAVHGERTAAFVVMQKGTVVPGADPSNTNNRCWVDPDIYTVAGLPKPKGYPDAAKSSPQKQDARKTSKQETGQERQVASDAT